MKKVIVAMTKVGLAGATIFAIGWGMLVLQPQSEAPVANADADISMFDFGPKSDQRIFADTLAQEGMEPPRAYDHNGNKLFFSTTTTSESPRQALHRLQRAFVENGLNQHVHLSPPANEPAGQDLEDPRVREKLEKNNIPRIQWANDYYGGIVPIGVEGDRVMMSGVTTKGGAENYEDYLSEVFAAKKELGRKNGDALGETVKAMRYMDVMKEAPGRSRITAVWSDEDYDPKKIANIAEPGDDLGVDPSIPVCPGCDRLMHLKGETEAAFDNHAFRAPSHSVDQMLGFYRRSLPDRGWKLSEAAEVMENAELKGLKPPMGAKMLNFAKGGRFLTVVAWDDEDQTSVHIARSN